MIDHLKLFVTDIQRSRAFYEQALAPLGVRVIMEPAPGVVGMGAEFPFLWLAAGAGAGTHCHGADNGGPGERPQYHPGYYSAFVLDPDGNNLEAVHHTWAP